MELNKLKTIHVAMNSITCHMHVHYVLILSVILWTGLYITSFQAGRASSLFLVQFMVHIENHNVLMIGYIYHRN